ncbi:MAG: hypothetical protein NT015_15295 [Alphaproteobacteria bacterium]|nr:hypothetical protein [Alphaproteobacteria bacterium]
MFIDFNQIARIGKLVALLGFFLPWVTVSCSNTDILTATGWQLMTGDPQPAGPLTNVDTSNRTDDAEPAVIIIAAFAIILAGLACSLFTKMQAAAITMLVTSVLGIGVSYYGVENIRTEMQRQIAEGQQEQAAQIGDNPFFSSDQLSQTVASNITVKEEEGYVVTHSGLLIVAIFSLLTLFRRRKAESETAQPSTSSG